MALNHDQVFGTNRSACRTRFRPNYRLARGSVAGGAKKLEAAFSEAMERLAVDPLLYPLASTDELRRLGVRQVYLKTRRGRPHRALFVVNESTVWILHVRGPGQRELDVVVPPPDLD